METSDTIALFAVILAFISFFYTLYIDIRSRKGRKILEDLNSKWLEKENKELEEEKKARIVANMQKNNDGKMALRIQNVGRGQAINVNWKLTEYNTDVEKWHFRNNPFPMDMQPNEFEDLRLIEINGIAKRIGIEITWQDGLKKDNCKIQHLNRF